MALAFHCTADSILTSRALQGSLVLTVLTDGDGKPCEERARGYLIAAGGKI